MSRMKDRRKAAELEPMDKVRKRMDAAANELSEYSNRAGVQSALYKRFGRVLRDSGVNAADEVRDCMDRTTAGRELVSA